MPEFMPQPLRQSESADLDARFYESMVNIGGEIFCYLTVPYPGCTKHPCDFCAYVDTGMMGLKMDERWREAVMERVERSVMSGAQTLVFFNNGNVLNSAEMDTTTILEHVPRAVANSSSCCALEIEVYVRSIPTTRTQQKLSTIRRNLSSKQLRVRVPVEYADDSLLSRHTKGITVDDTGLAIESLSSAGIPWIGYALLGGVEMTSEEARHAAIQTGKYIMDRGARMLSINGIFVTGKMQEAQEQTGKKMYLPSIEDLLEVLKTLSDYRSSHAYNTLIKVGLEEEDEVLPIVEYPYGLPASDPGAKKRMTGILNDFNRCQLFDAFLVEVTQNWTRAEALKCMR